MSTPNATVLETSGSELPFWDDLFYGRRTVYEKGFALAPDRPGLGIELNEDEAKKHPYTPKPWTSLHFPDGAIHDR
jgi:galactonate dehydratase